MDEQLMIRQMVLAQISGIGINTTRNLINQIGSFEGIFHEKAERLEKIPRINSAIAKSFQDPSLFRRAEQELRFMENNKIKMCFFLDEAYPIRLNQCPDAPLLIFFKGKLPARMIKSMSIVGTRKPTYRSKLLISKWITTLAEQHPQLHIISGLAYGIDIRAHEAAFEHHLPTLAVLGHGFHTIYPSTHAGFAEKICTTGALISDFFSNNHRDPKNFIKRNRIIAGITEATLVVESKMKGGAVTTADMANSYNRDVLAVPGRPGDEMAEGCNWLIKTNRAALVENVRDINYILGWESGATQVLQAELKFKDVESPVQRQILELLQGKSMPIETLLIHTGIPINRLSGILLEMELVGLISAQPGNRFCTNR